MTISFKNVGTLKSERTIERSESPIGIKTPLRNSPRFGLLDMYTRQLDQINDNLKNLLLTNYGERIMFPDFGANLKNRLFEHERAELEQVMASDILKTVSRYMPYIVLEDLNISFAENEDTNETNMAVVKVTYQVPTISDKLLSLDLAVTP